MEKFFKLKENGTNVRTEFIAGLTTFVTMAYVIFVNPNTLEASGMDKGAVFVATILAAIIGTLIMDWWQTFRMPKLREWGLTHSLHTPLFWDRDLPGSRLWHWFFFAD